jgi:hypothetical protein
MRGAGVHALVDGTPGLPDHLTKTIDQPEHSTKKYNPPREHGYRATRQHEGRASSQTHGTRMEQEWNIEQDPKPAGLRTSRPSCMTLIMPLRDIRPRRLSLSNREALLVSRGTVPSPGSARQSKTKAVSTCGRYTCTSCELSLSVHSRLGVHIGAVCVQFAFVFKPLRINPWPWTWPAESREHPRTRLGHGAAPPLIPFPRGWGGLC